MGGAGESDRSGSITLLLTILDLAGAIALLLWGVHMVQSGVQRALGARLRGLLAAALRDRVKAFFAGIGVTALLQSSTATALMVSGFSAAGMVGLAQALAVMLGANVGTTLIVQVLSFDIAIVAPILILAGVIMFMRFAGATRDLGRVFIGLGLLMLALHQMVGLLDPIMDDPAAKPALLYLASNTALAVLVAAILAWAAHSSVAVVLVAMSLAAEGTAPAAACFAFVLGANLGTAINPLLEGPGRGNPAARRLPAGNLINRLIGVFAGLAIFPYASDAVLAIDPDPARAVANFHTAFNLALALVFLPLVGPMAAVLRRVMPQRAVEDDPGAPLYLEPKALETPALALGAASREALRLADTLEAMLLGLKDALLKSDRQQIGETKRLDDVLDRLNTAIKDYLFSIESALLSEADTRRIAQIAAFSINLEQAGDLIDRNLLSIVTRRLKRSLIFSPDGQADLLLLLDRLIVNTRTAGAVFVSGDERAARALAAEKEAFRTAEADAYAAHFDRLRSRDREAIETSSLHVDALRDLKQVNAHLVEAAAYPLLRARGELLPSRIRLAE